jgi:anti-sigma B factor antagonist
VGRATRESLELKILEAHANSTTTLSLTGELDLAGSIALIDATRRALRRRPAVVRVDLRDVEFLDVTGARALIRCRRLASAARAELALVQPSYPVRRLLQISGLQAVFDTDDAGHSNGNGHAGDRRGDATSRPLRPRPA